MYSVVVTFNNTSEKKIPFVNEEGCPVQGEHKPQQPT